MTKPRHYSGIIFLIAFALLIRLAWAIIQPSTDAAIDRLPDQREYLSLGRNLLHSGTLSFIDPRFEQTVYAYRTPGYPAFIAILGSSPTAIRLAQAILDASTVLAVYLLAQTLSDRPKLPLLAACIAAANPFLIYFCGLILSETLFTSLLAWGLLLLARRRTAGAAIIFLLAVYVRPSAIFLAPILTLVTMLKLLAVRPYPLLPALRRLAIILLVTLVGLLPWAARNRKVLGAWIWTTSNSGVTLYDGFNDRATGASNQRFLAEMPQIQSINEVQRSQYLRHLATSWMADHPGELPGLTLRKIARTWSPVPLSAEYRRPIYRWIGSLYSVPLDLLIVAGLLMPVLDRRARMILLVPAIYFTIVHAMSVGSLRYRVPVEPELAIVAASGAIGMFCKDARRSGARVND